MGWGMNASNMHTLKLDQTYKKVKTKSTWLTTILTTVVKIISMF